MRSPALVFAFALSLASSLAFAEPMRLEYTRAPGCPAEQELRDAVAARVRAQPFDPAARSRLLVNLQSAAGRYHGVAELRDPSGAIAWTVAVRPASGDCAAVMDALALSIAIELGPQRRAQRAAGHRLFGVDGESLPVLPATPWTPDAEPTLPQATPKATPQPMRVRIGGGAALDVATSPGAPGLALGIFVDVGLRWTSFSIALEGRVDLPAGADVAPGVHVTTSRYSATIVPCGHFLGVVVACGLMSAGAVHGTGNADHPKSATVAHVAAGARAGVELPIGAHFALRLGIDGMITLARPILRLDGKPVYSAPLGSMAVGGGFLVSF